LPDPEDVSTAELPTAYVISVGVDKYANSAWDLNYASADARLSSETVSARLRAGGGFGRVVTLELVSAHNHDGNGQDEDRASREQIESVLARLGGSEPNAQILAGIAGAEELRPARPGDFVYFFFAGHGLAGRDGQFHLFPSNFGLGSHGREITQDSLQQTLNSDRLARLFRNIQAGNMVLVIDACNSAASVEGGGFKPGPMGSRGLGQLAYDKQMRVLTASQTEGVALESAELRHGVLSYAMFREGLDLGVADYQPTDRLVSFGELLRYAETRVPTLHNEMITGGRIQTDRAAVSMHSDARLKSVGFLQQPALFDFASDSTNRDIEMPILTTEQ
ncbi:MAG: caspase family protein, partial [Hyphomonas sp.]|nr:caspase family protein [Hyphomonas sp.]